MSMDWHALFIGSPGAGKTQAIRTIADAGMAAGEPLERGVAWLGPERRLVLSAAPTYERFRPLLDQLLADANGLVLLVDHSRPDAIAELAHEVDRLRPALAANPRPLVIGVTHADVADRRRLEAYHQWLGGHAAALGGRTIPVIRADTRVRRDVHNLLTALACMLEFQQRLSRRHGA